MKNFQNILILIALVLINITVLSQEKKVKYKTTFESQDQKLALISGDILQLKSEKSFNVLLNIDNFTLGLKDDPELVYINKKVTELDEKHPGKGKGEEWLKSWQTEKASTLPAFIEGFNSLTSKYGVIAASDDSLANITIILKQTSVQIINGHAMLNVYVDFVSTNNQKNLIASCLMTVHQYTHNKERSEKCPGTYLSAFYNTGETIAKYFEKTLYKSE